MKNVKEQQINTLLKYNFQLYSYQLPVQNGVQRIGYYKHM